MTVTSFLAGFVIATAGGALVTTVVIDVIAWRYVQRKLSLEKKKAGSLSLPLGIAERSVYFFALLVGAPSWIPFRSTSQKCCQTIFRLQYIASQQ